MKLRIRSLESNQTLKIEILNSSTLEQLKQSLIARLSLPSSSSSSSSSSSADSLFLSLNRKDELCGSWVQDSIQSLGVTSGARDGEELESRDPVEGIVVLGDAQKGELIESVSGVDENQGLGNAQKDETLEFGERGDVRLNVENTLKDETLEFDGRVEVCQSSDGEEEAVLESGDEGANGVDLMEVDEEKRDVNESDKYSVPSLLRRVLGKELEDRGSYDDNRILVISVHAVLLESGFVCYNPISGSKVDGFHRPDEWPSSAFTMSLCYSLPAILSLEVVETVVVKFQSLGKFVNVYGSLLKKGSGVYRVNLDKSCFVPALSCVWNNRDPIAARNERRGFEETCLEVEVFEFWRKLKDGLALPLLIDLCEKAGLLPPPCFMRLSTDLKLKILELLPGVSVARMACVCTELRFLSSNDDLWKKKFVEEFGDGTSLRNQGQNKWKATFASAWENWKNRKRTYSRWVAPPGWLPIYPVIRRDPYRAPFMIGGGDDLASTFRIGGDYDRVPGLGDRPHLGPSRRYRWPNCNLGGFNT
ncbi:F-box protein SKIP22-like protein [Drosera capensis]